jgi:hypothetical protein
VRWNIGGVAAVLLCSDDQVIFYIEQWMFWQAKMLGVHVAGGWNSNG